jgi:uncharacterized protein YcbK (DUF882 family)
MDRHAKLTENFQLMEFECHDGTPVPEEYYSNVAELAENLQILRDRLIDIYGHDIPITIISGYRPTKYNKSVGGADNSQHLYAKAADISSDSVQATAIEGAIRKLISSGDMKEGGLSLYKKKGFVHYDIRGHKARW